MGLDMYLKRKIYIGANYKHNNITGKIEIFQGEKNTPIKIDINKVSEIVESVGYWGKFNALHNWFVKNIQDGIDDCEDYWISGETLKQLLIILEKIYSKEGSPEELMPTQPGIFFGSIEYDEYYYQDVANSIDIIKTVLEETDFSRASIYYSSSW